MKLYKKSRCDCCQMVSEYLTSINANYKEINIDRRIPADLVELMHRSDFPEAFKYPILIDDKNNLYFGEGCLNFY